MLSTKSRQRMGRDDFHVVPIFGMDLIWDAVERVPTTIFHKRTPMRAAVNAPQSKRFAETQPARQSRKRLDCGGFSTAFEQIKPPRSFPRGGFDFILGSTESRPTNFRSRR